MSLPNELLPVGLLGTGAVAAEAEGYAIERSVRFNSSDSAYLSRTPSSAGNRKTWTWAGWVKRSGLGTYQYIWGNGNSSAENGFMLRLENTDTIRIADWTNTAVWQKITTQVFRDVSAWYHIVVSYDTTNGTAADRVRFYVNGSRVTTFSTNTDPTQNYDGYTNNTSATSIGRWGAQAAYYFSGYLADIHFIDGQALDPTSFGEFDDNGIWQPKAFSGGSYGTNGFHLDFADNSTAAALGTDSSGNGNTWTVNNISVTAGAGNDSLVDVPTNGTETDTGVGGEVRGNYCTWNPLSVITANGAELSNGNLDAKLANARSFGTVAIPRSGKWYFEVTVNSIFSVSGFVNGGAIGVAKVGTSTWSGVNVENGVANDGGIWKNSVLVELLKNATAGDVYGVAYDADTLSLQIYRNGAAYGNAITLDNADYIPTLSGNGNNLSNANSHTANFGQRPFAYTAPSGFKALCTANLPAPTIEDPSTVMDVLLWSGTGGNRSLTGLNMSPDFVWIKQRNQAYSVGHQLYDIVRGAGSLKQLDSSNTTAEGGGNTNQYGYLSSFDSAGFSVTAGSVDSDYVNKSGVTYVAWTWDAGDTTAPNEDGSITSSVRANPSAGFSIVTYTGNRTAGATVGHGLGVAPQLIFIKSRAVTGFGWRTYHASVGNTKYLLLNSTAAADTFSGDWNNTTPGSSVLTLGADGGSGNYPTNDTTTYVAYCFAPVAGYSSFGSYTGNGSADGPFVYTGFRPRWILIKNTTGSGSWVILDANRSSYNVSNLILQPNAANAEGVDTNSNTDFLSNGFKARSGSAFGMNISGSTYIYAAFAESPFQYARAR
jgi:hypothetical protein